MNPKAFLAMLLGLVFQLAQVQAGVSRSIARPEEKSCCTHSCPCVQNTSSEKPQSPAAPAPEMVKIIAVRADSNDPLTSALTAPPSMDVAGAEVEFQRFTGYPGVALSVAFCRFLM